MVVSGIQERRCREKRTGLPRLLGFLFIHVCPWGRGEMSKSVIVIINKVLILLHLQLAVAVVVSASRQKEKRHSLVCDFVTCLQCMFKASCGLFYI